MKFQTLVAVMVASCVLAGEAGAQVAAPVPHKGSWEIVESLPRGMLLRVKSVLADGSTQRVRCQVHSVDETVLVCGHWSAPRGYPYGAYSPAYPDRYVFPREQVVEVRMENEDLESRESAVGGAMAGAVVGGVLGYARGGGNSDMTRSGGAFIGSFVGALVGGAIGYVRPFEKGRVIYRR